MVAMWLFFYSEIEDLSNEIVNEMRKEPMVLQPQAGFGTAQEEVDRIYDYMQPMITCNENHYVGTKGNNGAYQDGAYAVCLEVCLQSTYENFRKMIKFFKKFHI